MNDTTRTADPLQDFLDDLIRDSDTPPPLDGEPDAEAASWARRIVLAELAAAPPREQEPAARARIWQRVLAARAAQETAPGGIRIPLCAVQDLFAARGSLRAVAFPGRRARAGFAALAVLVVAALGLFVWLSRTSAVSAQEIIEKARAAADAPAAAGVQSFVLSRTEQSIERAQPNGPAGEIRTETSTWYAAPNRWRSESLQRTLTPDGSETARTTLVQVGDGTDVWDYDRAYNTVVVNAVNVNVSDRLGVALFGQLSGSLGDLFSQVERCFDPHVTSTATVAGRPAYVIHLGVTRCKIASAPEDSGDRTVWVDEETYFVLKQELVDPQDRHVIAGSEVTAIQYNVPIDPGRFVFAAPAGAAVADHRPKPAPTADQFRQQLKQLAAQAGFPILAPTYVPAGLAPRQPRIDPTAGDTVELSYFPTDEPDKESIASLMRGIAIQEVRATSELVKLWTSDADPAPVGGNQGWLRRGVRNPDNTGTESTAYVLRDGVLLSVSSFTIPPEELLRVAAGLQTVPGSHAPLANPAP